MKKIKIYSIILCILFSVKTLHSQVSEKYKLSEPVLIELNRLGEAYQILDQFAGKVWDGWNDYMNYPFLFTFQNGLRVLIGHPAPPSVFVPYPDLKIRNLTIYLDTTNLNNFEVKQPLKSGGGPIPIGTYNNKPVIVVDIRITRANPSLSENVTHGKAENDILTFIHELMHCYQPQILKFQYGNLRINTDLNIALYSDIEGQALLKAYYQNSLEETLPFLKDFCIARSIKMKDLTKSEINSYECDEFREGEAVYSEVIILQNLKKGFKSSQLTDLDPAYNQFTYADAFIDIYLNYLKSSSGSTLDIYNKNYWYGCFEALLLQRYFPGWQKEVENQVWLDNIIRKRVNITAKDSLFALERFQNIYNLDSLKAKHGAIISGRDDAYKFFQKRKGRAYIINTKPVSQSLLYSVDRSAKNYSLGRMNMIPDGLGKVKFDSVSITFNPVPAEINELYYVKLIDTDSDKHKKPYKIKYESKDANGFYYNAIITTPLFTLKAPKISISESKNRIKFIIHSRV